MNKEVHDMDDLFRSALDQYEEIPSDKVKKNLETALGKNDAGPSKRKPRSKRKMVLLLLLLITGFILYETIFQSDSHPLEETSGNKSNDILAGNNKKTANTGDMPDYIGNTGPGSDKRDSVKINNGGVTTAESRDSILSWSNQKELSDALNKLISKAWFDNDTSKKESWSQKNKLAKDEIISFQAKRQEVDWFQDHALTTTKNWLQYFDVVRHATSGALVSDHIKRLQIDTLSFFQNNIPESEKQKKPTPFRPYWTLSPFASYERVGYRLDSDLPGQITNIRHSEIHEPSFSFGILATRQLRKNWGLQTGLVYSWINIGIGPQKLYALQNPVGEISFKYITSSGYAYIKPGLGTRPALGDSLVTTEGKHTLQLASVPLVLKYSIVKNRLSLIPGVGVEANFLPSARVETEVESPSSPELIFIRKLDGARKFHLSVVADAEIRYQLNNKLAASLRPAIRLATTPITKNNVVETFPKSFGLGLGVTYKF